MKLVSDLAGGAGDLGGRVRRGFDGFRSPTPPKDAPGDTPTPDEA
jgi:hypothetical protein